MGFLGFGRVPYPDKDGRYRYGVCSSRCPAGISHPQVAMLARRLNGKYLAPKSEHLENRVREIENGTFDELMEALMGKPASELQELYNNRDIEK